MTTLPVEKYKSLLVKNKIWSDQFLPLIKRILGQAFISTAPLQIDYEQATDLIVLTLEPITIACRIRSYDKYNTCINGAHPYREQFTIRTTTRWGLNKSELEKIKDGWVQYYFYGFANQDDTSLIQWFIGDVDILHEQLICVEKGLPTRLKWEEHTNGQGDNDFNAYWIDSLPDTFMINHSKRFPPLNLDLFDIGKILTSGHKKGSKCQHAK